MKKLLVVLLLLLFSAPAEVILTIIKTPFEVLTLAADFVQATGPVTLVSVTAKNSGTNVDNTAQIVAASPVPAVLSMTKKVVFAVQGGVSGQTYDVSIKVVDSTTGEKLEGTVIVHIAPQ